MAFRSETRYSSKKINGIEMLKLARNSICNPFYIHNAIFWSKMRNLRFEKMYNDRNLLAIAHKMRLNLNERLERLKMHHI